LIEYLEDKENDNLASALKDATLAQLGNAESYLQDEYDEIQKALEIEEALQEIKDSDTDEKLDDETEPVDVKRSEPTYEDNLGVWYEQPIVDQGIYNTSNKS
jgi:predicted  nucleic acid-binding Zn-ribbon protein